MTPASEAALPGDSLPPDLPEPEALSLAAAVETLLKRPVELFAQFQRGNSKRITLQLLAVAGICLTVFGLIIGLFSLDPLQLVAVPLKITLGLLVSALICLPSLYIFGSLSGLDLKLQSIAGVLIASIALAGLLLVGFTPVVWIFSTSTNSIGFMGFLLISFWLIALFFGFSFLFKASRLLGGRSRAHLGVWVAIFTVVTLQMTTTLRPIVAPAGGTQVEDLLPGLKEKRFFLVHWGRSIGAELDPGYRK